MVSKKKVSKKQAKLMSLDEFKALAQPDVWNALKADAASGKGFEACHKVIFEKTGIWVEELVPILRKLDANLLAG